MIDLPIRSCVRPGFVWARRGRGFFATQRLQICGDWILSTQSSPMRGDWILSTQSSPIPIGRWGTRGETTLLLFHPRCKQNFVVVFVSFFLGLESIEQTSTSHKMLRNQFLQHVCKQGEMTFRSALYQTLTLKLSSSAQKCWRYVQFRLMIGEKQTR